MNDNKESTYINLKCFPNEKIMATADKFMEIAVAKELTYYEIKVVIERLSYLVDKRVGNKVL